MSATDIVINELAARLTELEAERDAVQHLSAQADRHRDELLAENAKLRDVLRHVQWAELKMEGMDGPSVYVCVACGSVKPNDHQPRCSIAAALGEPRWRGGEPTP